MTTQTIERSAQRTCANCPYFQDFGEANGRGWCHAFDQMARQHYQRTGACDQEIEAQEEAQQQPAPEPEPQPAGLAFYEVGSSLQSSQSACPEFDFGRHHGQQDAAAQLHPICTEATCPYSAGYLDGYKSFSSVQQQPQPVKQTEWSVAYDPKWQWYQAWVGDRLVGRGATHQSAERIAQKYIATDEMIRRQNRAVLQAYAG